MTSHLHPVNAPPAESTTDMVARRVAIQQAVVSLLDHEPPTVNTDDARLALLTERVGEVGAVYWRGHTDIEGELLRVCATAQKWLEDLARERAR